jgi:hypothetical protein
MPDTDWQIGDGREEALAARVENHATMGEDDDAIRVPTFPISRPSSTAAGRTAVRSWWRTT